MFQTASAATPSRAGALIQTLVVRALAALQRADADDMPADPIGDLMAGTLGPGWFDSSWDLARGLDVCEGLPADPTLDEGLTFHGHVIAAVAA